MGHESRMFVRYRKSADDSVVSIIDQDTADIQHKALMLEQVIQPHYINAHRSDFGNTLFSLPYPGYDLSALPQVQAADIINLHWTAYFQSPVTLNRLLATGKPVVWTLHDQWPFTGGCHYTAGCVKYRQDCAACPQLVDDVNELPAAILKDRESYLRDGNLTIVTPSRWLASCARESRLFERLRVEVIPYSLDADLFHPLPKSEAKAKLGLETDKVTLLFGAQDGTEKRKGFQVLLAAIRHCLNNVDFRQWVANDRLRILCFGYPPDELMAANIPTVSLGQLSSDEDIIVAYSAADLFILPSLEDNLPNTLLEAMSCGTPVIASNVGGIPELVVDGVTGYLTLAGSAQHLGETILSAILDLEQLNTMGQQSRKRIEKDYRLEVQAKRYLDLYTGLGLTVAAGGAAVPQRARPTQPSTQKTAPDTLLVTEVGPYFERIYKPVLLQALQEFAPFVYEKWQASESDRATRLRVIQEQGQRLGEIEADRNNVRFQLADLQQNFETTEVDRAARLVVIEEQGHRLGQVEAERNNLRYQLADLQQHFEAAEADRAARLVVIEEQGQRLDQVEAERNNLQTKLSNAQHNLHQIQQQLAENEEICGNQASLIEAQEHQLHVTMAQLRRLQELFHTIQSGRVYRIVRRLGCWRWVEQMLNQLPRPANYRPPVETSGEISVAETAQQNSMVDSALVAYQTAIAAFNASQPNKELLNSIRAYNHLQIDNLDTIRSLERSLVLDIGASPHGYALERALELGVTLYIGIGLDVTAPQCMRADSGSTGLLFNMDATSLQFPAELFDSVISLSTFEHVLDVSTALSEIARVLKPDGIALISFEPIWSCSLGHHLHHFGNCAKIVPPWAHLIWSTDEMRQFLAGRWPNDAPISIEQAIEWIYEGHDINRLTVRQLRTYFSNSPLRIEWIVDMKEENIDLAAAQAASETTGLTIEELTTRGLTVLLKKAA
jgi:glycosyltransferase involved in cell wall biosynthesis/ubiquinone/menaquinone biosynthesis C-methylase UbiE